MLSAFLFVADQRSFAHQLVNQFCVVFIIIVHIFHLSMANWLSMNCIKFRLFRLAFSFSLSTNALNRNAVCRMPSVVCCIVYVGAGKIIKLYPEYNISLP